MEILLKIIHVTASVFLILVVLLQSGRGGGMGAAFGGASGQIFGGRGAGSFLSRLTSGAAVVFFLTSLTLSMMSSRHRSVVMNNLPKSAPSADPAAQDPNGGEETSPAPAAAPAGGAKPEAAGDAAKPGAAEAVQPGKADEANRAPATAPDAPAPTPPGVPSGAK